MVCFANNTGLAVGRAEVCPFRSLVSHRRLIVKEDGISNNVGEFLEQEKERRA